ncbi:MAG: DUF4476 domain-containing protein [Bacteroidia bacterium]
MKKLLLCMMVFLSGQLAQAQLYSNLSFFTPQGERFQVVINGKLQNIDPETHVTVEHIEEEYVATKIIFEDQTLGQVDQKLFIPIGNHYTYEIRKNTKGNKYVIRPMGEKPISSGGESEFGTAGTGGNINSTPKPTTTNTSPNPTTNGTNGNANSGNNNNATTININLGGVGVNATLPNGGNGTVADAGWQPKPSPNPTPPPSYSGFCPYPMYDADFANVLQAVENESFKDRQVAVAKQAVGSQCVKVNQIAQLLDKFSFEDSKLEVAKYCYTRCCDPQNYYQLNNSFTFNSNKEELNKYINGQPKPTGGFVSGNVTPGRPSLNGNGGANMGMGCMMPMDPNAFSMGLNSLQEEGIDNTRLKMAKQMTSMNCLSVAQIKEVANLFSFESSKLDYAKYAYAYCYDKGNYFMLNDIFSFSSSKEALSKHIMGR